MTRFIMLVVTLAVLVGAAPAQQPDSQLQQPQQQQQRQQPQAWSVEPTRTYRSYSVNPSNPGLGRVRRSGPRAGAATWRQANAKADGHYGAGR